MISALLAQPVLLISGLFVSVLLLWWAGRRLSRLERPDDALSNLAMLIGLGWSSEAIWELTGRIDGFPTELRYLVFFVLEVLLILAMIRARRAMNERGHPGRSGRTAWIVAVVMSVVAAAVSESLAEAALRAAIPLLVVNQWWDGLVGEERRRPADATSWRWTPRRLLLRLGAIEPGERDVETVHRERLTQQMTRLEFRRRYGSQRRRGRVMAKLSRLSLVADDAIIEEVRQRVARANWFTVTPLTQPADASATRHSDASDSDAPRGDADVLTSSGADPSTRAALLYRLGKYDSIRGAAGAVPGANEATVRRRLAALNGAATTRANGHK